MAEKQELKDINSLKKQSLRCKYISGGLSALFLGDVATMLGLMELDKEYLPIVYIVVGPAILAMWAMMLGIDYNEKKRAQIDMQIKNMQQNTR